MSDWLDRTYKTLSFAVAGLLHAAASLKCSMENMCSHCLQNKIKEAVGSRIDNCHTYVVFVCFFLSFLYPVPLLIAHGTQNFTKFDTHLKSKWHLKTRPPLLSLYFDFL